MSVKYELVKFYYDEGLWSAERLHTAIGKWITREEANEIMGL